MFSIDGQPLSDAQFFEMLCNEDIWIFDGAYPNLPQEEVQINFTGAAGKDTLKAGYDFWVRVKQSYRQPFNDATKVLDFGCGFGRITRFWIKDVARENIYGVDPLPEMIDICRQSISGARFLVSNPEPPLPYPDCSFDIITAYSVFSHLSEAYFREWFNEFGRILKQDGILAVTTRSRLFIEYCSTLERSDSLRDYAKTLRHAFDDRGISLRQYDGGEFVHKPIGGGGTLSGAFYGESCIPVSYFRRLKAFVVMDTAELPYESTQLFVVMRKS
jgi:SAM-dependent methyltransferase